MAGQKTIVSGVAGRYATALFELALEEKKLDAVKQELKMSDLQVKLVPVTSSTPVTCRSKCRRG